jgi:hypothetical protein
VNRWIYSERPEREVWRRLLQFANPEFSFDELVRRHGLPSSKSSGGNFKKQAKQIRASLLQAQEYFQAASASSVVTSPNHLYYGFVSLASMVMLLLGTGEQSLDYLRRDSSNRRHGLLFSTPNSVSSSVSGLTLLENTFVEILERGHFANWYKVLPREHENYGIIIKKEGTLKSTTRAVVGTDQTKHFAELIGRKYSALALLRGLPDLAEDLAQYDVDVPFSRVDYTVTFDEKINTHSFMLQGTKTPEDMQSILKGFATLGDVRPLSIDIKGGTAGCIEWSGPILTVPTLSRQRVSDRTTP